MGIEVYITKESGTEEEHNFSVNFWKIFFNDNSSIMNDILSPEDRKRIHWPLVDTNNKDEYGDPTDDFEEVFKDPVEFKTVLKKIQIAMNESTEKYRLVQTTICPINESYSDHFSKDFETIEKICNEAIELDEKIVLYGFY